MSSEISPRRNGRIYLGMNWDSLFLREWSRWSEEIGKAERLLKDVRAMEIGAVLRNTALLKR
jgi:hypothetical protein